MQKSLNEHCAYCEETINGVDKMIDVLAVKCDHVYEDGKSALVQIANELNCKICGEDF